VVSAGWWLRAPSPAPAPAPMAVQVKTPQPDPGYALLPVAGTVEADFTGAVRSRAIDAETGQVTLEQVYAQ
jgi:hypothetical protein